MKNVLAIIHWLKHNSGSINRVIIISLTVFDLYLFNLIFEPALFSKVLASLNQGFTSITSMMSEFDSKQRAIIGDMGSPLPTSTPKLSPSPTPNFSPFPSVLPSPTPTVWPSATPTPELDATNSPTPSPSSEDRVIPSASPSVSPEPSPESSEGPSPIPSESPIVEPEIN